MGGWIPESCFRLFHGPVSANRGARGYGLASWHWPQESAGWKGRGRRRPVDVMVNERPVVKSLPESETGPGTAVPGISEGPDPHPAIPALANLFLVLFLWVAGTALAVFLGQELLKKGYFSTFQPDSLTPEDPTGTQAKKVSRMIAIGTANILVFPAQVLLLMAMMRHPATGCPSGTCPGGRPSTRAIFWVGLLSVIGSHVLWMLLGIGLNRFFSQGPEAHPLSFLLVRGGRWGLALVALQGCLIAPVLEEVLCRGYLMALLSSCRPKTNGLVGMVVSLVLVGFAMDSAQFQGNLGWFNGALLAALLVLPVFFLRMVRFQDPDRLGLWSGIVAQAQIFACLHASSWPAPVALMPLALGLGWIRASGQSLSVCVVVHSLFNLVSLLLAGMVQPA